MLPAAAAIARPTRAKAQSPRPQSSLALHRFTMIAWHIRCGIGDVKTLEHSANKRSSGCHRQA
eukprot:1899030-Rhodomonas_salina.1